jgi:tetratricopeptide (TPR) repeat protein
MRQLVCIAAVLALLLGVTDATASSALELVRMARAYENARQDEVAVRRYMEALALDPTCEEAYLGLGALRARGGDLREAERVYSVALEHVPRLRAARAGRAHVRRAMGQRTEAIEDLLLSAEDDVSPLRVLATWYGEDGQTPAQLATWRRIAARAESSQDALLQNEARTMIRALVILVGPADPAASPPDERGVRRLVATLAKKGG